MEESVSRRGSLGQRRVAADAIRRQFAHDDPQLNAAFDDNFTPIVWQMYDEATEGLEQYQ